MRKLFLFLLTSVIGLGLIGQLVVQLLKANGCRVFGLDLDEKKVELARQFGADIGSANDEDAKRRQLYRRISVAPGDRLRTASERIAMLDLETIGAHASPLTIQDRHGRCSRRSLLPPEFQGASITRPDPVSRSGPQRIIAASK